MNLLIEKNIIINDINRIRKVQVWFYQISTKNQIHSGSHLFNLKDNLIAINDLGYVNSSCFPPILQSYIALGFVKDGVNRYGDLIKAYNPLLKKEALVEVCNPVFVDPNEEKLRG